MRDRNEQTAEDRSWAASAVPVQSLGQGAEGRGSHGRKRSRALRDQMGA